MSMIVPQIMSFLGIVGSMHIMEDVLCFKNHL